MRRCADSNRLTLVRSAKKTKDSSTPPCTKECCKHCPDDGDMDKKCDHPTDWDDDWDEDTTCDKWKHIDGYHLWGYT